MPEPIPPQPPHDDELPDALTRALVSICRTDASVPWEWDDGILASAKAGVARRLRFRRVILPFSTAAAAAAAVVMVSVWVRVQSPSRSEQAMAPGAPAASM